MKYCERCGAFYGDDDAGQTCPADGHPLSQVKTADEDQLDELLGQLVDGRFLLEALLGRGGMGAVFKATQVSVDRPVALKVILGRTTDAMVKRFLREARTTSRLRNVHTVTVHDFGVHEGRFLYLAMELLEGTDLRQRVAAQGPLGWRRALHILQQVAASLAEAHDLGVIHRDMKSDNVFLVRMGKDPDFVKVLDFGIAKLQEADGDHITNTGTVVGTPEYLSPEQAQGHPVDHRADLYALGIMLFEMLAGRVPFRGDTPLSLLLKHTMEPLPSVHDVYPQAVVPAGVQALLERLTAKDPAARPESAAQLQAICDELLASDGARSETLALAGPAPPVSAGYPTRSDEPLHDARTVQGATLRPGGGFQTQGTVVTAPPPHRPRRRAALLGAAAGLVVLLAALVAAGVLTPRPQPPEPGQTLATTARPEPADGPTASPPTPATTQPPADAAETPPEAHPQPPRTAQALDAGAPSTAPDAGPAASAEAPDAGPTASPEAPDARPTAPADAGPPTVRVDSQPVRGATVRDRRGRVLGQTPLTLPSPEAPVQITLEHPRFARTRARLARGARGEITVQLRPKPSTRRKRPKRKPRGPGIDLLDL